MDIHGKNTAVPLHSVDRLFIGGAWTKPISKTSFEVINPSTEELFFRVAEACEEDVTLAVAAARVAFDSGPWPRLSHVERATYVRALGRELSARADDVSYIWSSEMGAVHSLAQTFSAAMGGVFDYYAGLAKIFPFEEERPPTAGGQFGLIVREPVGVVGAIIPWNAPIMLIAYKIAPALLAGCTIIIKASPEAPGAAYVIAEIAEKIGLPAGVLNVVTADRHASEILVRSKDVDKISFTGSTTAGRKIASLCGDRIARCTLELGGKSAAVILDDYDLEVAASSIAASATIFTGQACSSLTRIIVSDHRHDAFVDALSAAFSQVKVGDPFESSTQMGPLAMRRQRDRVEELIGKGRDEGAFLATGGARPSGSNRGFFIEPTVFGNVKNNSTIAREEIFGPVLSVIPARDEADAIEIANDSIYGLNASVFTNDIDRAYSVSRKLLSGTVGHNSFRSDFGISFGGFKQSGIGREGGIEGLRPYLETKAVILEAAPSQYVE